MFVMVAFTIMLCFWANQSPAAPSAPPAEKSSVAASASTEEESPGFIEQEETATVAKKGKKFPWLIVGAVVVIGAVAFLLLQSKKYELAVTLSEGCTGTPAETAKFKKNAAVNYSYSTTTGYGNLQVKLDGVAVAASGTVTMDKAHTLDVSATYGAAVNITSTPSGAKVYDNYVDSGKTTPASYSYTSAGSHVYLLRQCGFKDYSKAQSVVVGQTYNINASLVAGILDNFLVAPTCWVPYIASDWTQASGLYKANTKVAKWQYSYYNTVFSSSTYTVEAKMKRVAGSTGSSNSIVLCTATNMNSVNGYLFNYSANGYYSIWKWTGIDMVTYNGTETGIKGWSYHSRINKNLGAWNVMKIVRSGSNYSFYMNGYLVYSFADSSFDPRVCVLPFYSGNAQTEMHYDYVKLDVGAAQGLMPGERVTSVPDSGQKGSHHQ
jgi:hypothetical protein